MARTCSIDGCEAPIIARSWCSTHYRRWKRHGNPLTVITRRKRTFDELVPTLAKNECWPWRGTLTNQGYGFFYKGRVDGNVKYVLAHRLAWEKANRPLRPDEIVLHLCDNPPCVNPAHLQAGSYADNMQDASQKGRLHGRPGEKHHRARLTEADVRLIRQLAPTTSHKELAARFDVGRSHISDLVNRKRWNHID